MTSTIFNNESGEKKGFKFGGILFEEQKDGKIKCGICETKCTRPVLHLNRSGDCSIRFDMPQLKLEYSKYRSRIRSKAHATKGTKENKEKFEAEASLNNDSDESIDRNDTRKEEVDTKGFKFGGVLFEEINNGKIRCGICQTECLRLVVHLNSSERCSSDFDMPILKIEYSKYRCRNRRRVCNTKRKAEDLNGFQEKANESRKKHATKMMAEDLNKFKDEANQREKKRQTKRKAEDLDGFQEKAKESWKKHTAKKKAEDPKGYKENINEQKLRSENNLVQIRESKDLRAKYYMDQYLYAHVATKSYISTKLRNTQRR